MFYMCFSIHFPEVSRQNWANNVSVISKILFYFLNYKQNPNKICTKIASVVKLIKPK